MPKAKVRVRQCKWCEKEYSLDDEGARHKFCSVECYKADHAKTFLTSKRCPIKTRNSRLKNKYGISVEDYKVMHEAQGGKCFVCDDSYEILHVDHCHSSGKVRKLLCSKCNQALGLLREDVSIMKEMINYVENHC